MSKRLVVEIVGDADALSRAFGKAAGDVETFGSRVGKASKIAGAAILGGLGLAAKAGFSELAEGQKVAAQTEAVLKSTGGSAKVTGDHIAGLAAKFSELSGVDDEAIQAGENLLLTFTGIRNEVGKGNDIFDQATKATLNLSVAMGKDMSSSAILVGKALNDPIKGMNAMTRAGIQFTDAQKKQIAALVESGDKMGAQKIILKELETQFGGSAKAAGETLPGQLNKAKNAFAEVAAGVVQALLPALQAFASIVSKVSGFLSEHERLAKVLAVAFTGLGIALIAVGSAMKIKLAMMPLITAAQWAWNAALAANPLGLVVIAIAALAAALVIAWKHSETFRNIVTGAWEAVRTAVGAVVDFFTNDVPAAFEAVLDWVKSNWKTIAVLISGPFAPLVALATDAFGIRSALTDAFQAVLDWVTSNWRTIATIISGPFAPLVALATDAFGIRSKLQEAFAALVKFIGERVGEIVGFFTALPGRLAAMLGTLASTFSTPFSTAFETTKTFVGARVDDVVDFFVKLPGRLAGMLGALGSAFIEKFQTAFRLAQEFIGKRVDDVVAFFVGLPKRLANTLGSLGSTFIQPFQNAVRDAKDFVKDRVDDIVAFFEKLPGRIAGFAKGLGTTFVTKLGEGLADLGSKLVGWIKGPINAIISAWNSLSLPSFSVNIPVPFAPDISFSTPSIGLPDIPHLAKGGIVRSPTIAMLGESGSEAVIPLGHGMGGPQELTVRAPVYIDSRQIGEVVYQYLLDRSRSSGSLFSASPGVRL